MRRASGHPEIGALRRFDRLSRVDHNRLAELAQKIEVHEAESGTALVELDSRAPYTVFLLDGKVRLEAHDGHIRVINHEDPAARNPLCRLRPTRWRALAAGPVRYLQINDDLLDECIGSIDLDSAEIGYSVHELGNESVDEESSQGENGLLFRLYDDLNRNRLVLRSLPRVARNIGRIVADMEENPLRVGQLLMLDPVLALKALKAANAPPTGPTIARSCAKATERLGSAGTHRLLVQCALLESFRPDSAALNYRMHAWRERSLMTAALSRSIAEVSDEMEPNFAELVGLAQGIGEAAILSYADRQSDMDSDLEALDSCMATQSTDAGRMLLGRWPLPAELAVAAGVAGNWWRDTGRAKPDYADLALVAQLLTLTDMGRKGLPGISTVPAAQRLGLDLFSQESVTHMLNSAHQKVIQAESSLAV